ncbi:MAG: carboxypeptidase-like regulatory domain-containing protein [Bacteroidales bacterium]|jgi:hypothetical protein|nr:carboxypeptidase-like regulatory domain-containing protein [Bacteroidales bacterium]
MKIILPAIILLSFINQCLLAFDQDYFIAGKVYINEYEMISSVDGSYIPAISPVDAYIRIKGENGKGHMADSGGFFRIDHLKPGKYQLNFSCVGCFSFDTTIFIKNAPVESLKIILPLWYDQEKYSVRTAKKEIKTGHATLFACTNAGNKEKFFADQFWKKYQIGYLLFEKELIQKKEQHFSAPLPVLIKYNQEIFKYLDKTFGNEWHHEAPPGILGLKEWISRKTS